MKIPKWPLLPETEGEWWIFGIAFVVLLFVGSCEGCAVHFRMESRPNPATASPPP